MKKLILSAPAKLILTGEHAVVYGYPAIAMAINKRLKLEVFVGKNSLNWKINSEIPARCGLGSSAALSAAQAALLLYLKTKEINKELICEISFNLEKIHHGKPSGLDNTIAVYGGLILFKKFEKVRSLKTKNLPEFLLINSGKPTETTKEMVKNVESRIMNHESKKILENIGKLSNSFVKALSSKDFKTLGLLITENEGLLEKLGVVGKKARKIIREIERLGGSAKICGAGGVKSGSGIILVHHRNQQNIKEYCQKNKLSFFMAKLDNEGVKHE